MGLPSREQFEAWLKEDAERILEDLCFAWVEIPGEIAESAVFRLVYEHKNIGLTLDTTLREIGQLLGMLDDQDEWT